MKRPRFNDPQEQRDFIENLYTDRGVDNYRLRNVEDLKEIYGIDIEKLKGYEKFSEDYKKIIRIGIISYFNNHGLIPREKLKPKKVEIEKRKFKVTFGPKDYIYIFGDGSIG